MEQVVEFVKEVMVADKDIRYLFDRIEELYAKHEFSHFEGSETWAWTYLGPIYGHTILHGRSEECKQKLEALSTEQQVEAMRTIMRTRREWMEQVE